MTDLEKAARQALDALESLNDWPGAFDKCERAVDALRAALAQQAEPVPPWYRQFCNCPKCSEAPKQAEPVAESHRRATTGASGQSMTQADSGNPSF